jgi:uncharacterized protein (TIGR03492 family)
MMRDHERGEAERGRVLLISNGHGEDQISAVLGKSLAEVAPELALSALPLVGSGQAYLEQGIPLLMQGENLPSGGFSRNSLKNLWMDIKAGLLGDISDQIHLLKRVREKVDLAVCVGDVYLIILAGNFLRKPIYFLPTAKSDYIASHWRIEVSLMRRFCQRIFPRDAKTAASLAKKGLPAAFMGNLMMDCLYFKDPAYFGQENGWVIALLPGSRGEAYDNMVDLAEVLLAFERMLQPRKDFPPCRYLLALAGGLDPHQMAEKITPFGWRLLPAKTDETANGILGHLQAPAQNGEIQISIVKGRFADVLAASDLVLGLAGTGNEQAVGLGKPVITFPGRGPQFSQKFARIQKRLLGDAVSLVDREPVIIARELLKIITDASRREQMGRIGQERMGPPGGAHKIALQIKDYFQSD